MKEKKRKGYTTGSCCAAGAAAALTAILANKKYKIWNMVGPTGVDISVPINFIELDSEKVAKAVVIKDGGDDPDVTTGAKIIITVTLVNKHEESDSGYLLNDKIYLKTGIGVGIVTKQGLACPKGKAAVNPGPRNMILNELVKVCEKYSYKDKLTVEIEIPDGVKLAEKTFNPKLGIKGGISILGTTGIVEPMSDKAILDTIKVELSVAKAMGEKEKGKKIDTIVITPGNYGMEFLNTTDIFKNIPNENIIKVSNFIGESIQMAAIYGFENIIVSGHLGKMIKVAGGMLDTHSKYGDNRIKTAIEIIRELDENSELMRQLEDKISEAVMVDEIIRLLKELGGKSLVKRFSKRVCEKVEIVLNESLTKLNKRYDKIKITVIIFTNKYGLLASNINGIN